jgi:hypothetical protein
MKTSKINLLLLAIIVVASVLCWNVYSAEKARNQTVWEYKVVRSMGDNIAQLSELGNQGWELTSLRTEEEVHGSFRQTNIYYYLKRSQQVKK